MSAQLALDGLTAEPQLSERQAQALAIIREHAPIRSEDLGAELYPRVHDLDRARSFGRSVGDALAAKGLVVFVRGEGWVPADWRGAKREGAYDPATAEVPF